MAATVELSAAGAAILFLVVDARPLLWLPVNE
jgi:hypothetical protein